jgi:hypothetical protein
LFKGAVDEDAAFVTEAVAELAGKGAVGSGLGHCKEDLEKVGGSGEADVPAEEVEDGELTTGELLGGVAVAGSMSKGFH